LSDGKFIIGWDEENECYFGEIFLYSGFSNVTYNYGEEEFYGSGTGNGIIFWIYLPDDELVMKHYPNGSDDFYDCEEIAFFV
jgi:hypothetical protein